MVSIKRRQTGRILLLVWATLFLVCTRGAIAHAQGFSIIHSFDPSSGEGGNPVAGLMQGADGNFYGTAFVSNGDSSDNNQGTVFTIAPNGTFTTVHQFCPIGSDCSDGTAPFTGLIQGTDGNFYGTTTGEMSDQNGTVFKMLPDGTVTTLHQFCGWNCPDWASPAPDGSFPDGALVHGTDGNFYGTTAYGGIGDDGTVFKITPSGELTLLYNFCPSGGGVGSVLGCGDGFAPSGALVQGTDGNFYGITSAGGNDVPYSDGTMSGFGGGTVFQITPSGTLTTLYRFCSQPNCTDGENPDGGLVLGTDGNLYGTTHSGGAYDPSLCHSRNGLFKGCGTIFKVSTTGNLTTIHSFCQDQGSCTDGAFPGGGLIQATDGNFYGTTGGGGNFAGTAFEITPSGNLTTLHSFCANYNSQECLDGSFPYSALVQGNDGNLYGTTYEGGSYWDSSGGEYGYGTIFSLSLGLPPKQ